MQDAEEKSGALMRESRQKKKARQRAIDAKAEAREKKDLKQQAHAEAVKFREQKQARKVRASIRKYSPAPVLQSIHQHSQNAYERIVSDAKESAAKAATTDADDASSGHSLKHLESFATFNEKNKKAKAKVQIEKTGKFVERENIEARSRERDRKTEVHTRQNKEAERLSKRAERAGLHKQRQEDQSAEEEARRAHRENLHKMRQIEDEEAPARAKEFIESQHVTGTQRLERDELRRRREERSFKSRHREKRFKKHQNRKFHAAEDDYQNTDAGEWKLDRERSRKANRRGCGG